MGEIFISVLLPLAVVVIMFCLGLGLTAADFQRIGRRPRAFCVGALNQIIFRVAARERLCVFNFQGNRNF